MKQIPSRIDKRYDVSRRIGTGGMADVYLAVDTQLDREVALKILHSRYANDPSFVDRFKREAHAAANLQHPNVVKIYDWGKSDDFHFIVMERIEGNSLKDLIASDAPLAPHKAAVIATQVLGALGAAHRNGVVHRDIKPGNILLDLQGKAHVADFGIARATSGDTMTQTGTILGTAFYLSPEQAQGNAVDGRSDIYSASVCLYEMLTARRPFEGDSPVTIAMKHVREQPKPLTDYNSKVPLDLSAITLTGLAKNPEDRYSTAAQMQRDLQAFIDGKPVNAVMPAASVTSEDSTQIIKTVSADRRAAARRPGWLLALATALLIGGLALGAWSLVNLFGAIVGNTSVPNIVGQEPLQASSVLRARGLSPAFQDNEPSDTIEEGKITRQLPDPGRSVADGSEVKYWVSTGLAEVVVPNLVGRPRTEAQKALEAAGLVVGNVEEVFDQSQPAGTVLDQNPRAGAIVRKRDVIDLRVSKGAETATVPDVRGAEQNVAVLTLSNAGFRVTVTNEFREDVPEGRVFAQDPNPGEIRPRGDNVTIFVSRRAQNFPMPDVRGRTEADARDELERRGLSVEVRRQFTPNDSQVGNVIEQDPDAGTTVNRGETVTIFVGDDNP